MIDLSKSLALAAEAAKVALPEKDREDLAKRLARALDAASKLFGRAFSARVVTCKARGKDGALDLTVTLEQTP